MTFSLSAKSYYISPSGSDSNDGSEESPFQTVDKAFNYLSKGTILIFKDGDYDISNPILLDNLFGTESQFIVIKAENIGKVKFIFSKSIVGENITIRSSSLIKIEGIQFIGNGFENKSTHNIILAIRNSDSITVRECFFSNAYEEGLKVSNSSDICVYNNRFDNFFHEGIDFLNVSNSLIFNNLITNVGRVGIMIKGGSQYIYVHNNEIKNNQQRILNTAAITIGGMTGFTSAKNYKKGSFEAYNIFVFNNFIIGNQYNILRGVAFYGAKNSYLFNNIIKSVVNGVELVQNNSTEYGWEENVNNENIVISGNEIENYKNKEINIIDQPNGFMEFNDKFSKLNDRVKREFLNKIYFRGKLLRVNYLVTNYKGY